VLRLEVEYWPLILEYPQVTLSGTLYSTQFEKLLTITNPHQAAIIF
jgi:hypothetical protein